MKTKVFVLVPYSVPAGEISAYIHRQLEKHFRNDSDPQRNGRFDYLVGPLETLFADEVTESRLPPKTRRTYHGNICEMNRLPFDATAGAIVTADGVWHDLSDFGWRMMSDSSQANQDAISQWNIYFRELLSKHPDSWIVAIWAHS